MKGICTVVVIVLLVCGIAIFVLGFEEKRRQRKEAEGLKRSANRE
jgi:Flp pilus assembly protein TadB